MATASETVRKPITRGQIKDLTATLATAIPDNLSSEEAQRLIGKKGDLIAAVREVLVKLSRPEAAEPPVHKDIRIEFTLGGRPFEAVGFLKAGESSVSGDEMLSRTDKDGTVVGEEDWAFVYEHRGELPEDLRRYYLATKRPDPGGPRGVSYLRHVRHEWCEGWGHLGLGWGGRDLVLRRRT